MATWIECRQKRPDFKITEHPDGQLSATWTNPRGVGVAVVAANDHPDARIGLVNKCSAIIAREDEMQAEREARAASASMQRKPHTKSKAKKRSRGARLVTR